MNETKLTAILLLIKATVDCSQILWVEYQDMISFNHFFVGGGVLTVKLRRKMMEIFLIEHILVTSSANVYWKPQMGPQSPYQQQTLIIAY